MMTLAKIYKEMTEFRTAKGAERDPRKYPNISFSSLEVKGNLNMKSVLFKGESIGSQGDRYSTHVEFHGLQYSDKPTPQHHPADLGDNQTAYFKTLSYNSTKVKLYCSCDDARHTAAWPLYKKGSWLVRPKAYTRVPGSTRPPRNPLDKAIVCKHIHSLIGLIQSRGIIR